MEGGIYERRNNVVRYFWPCISGIHALIKQKKEDVKRVVNDAMVSLYWGIEKRLAEEITGVNKPEYGKRAVLEISKKLSVDHGSGFDKPVISRMINFTKNFLNTKKL